MTVTFVSNYINHHQIPFCNAMYKALEGDFCFIQTQPMEDERVQMGWGQDVKKLPYLKLYYEEPRECKKRIDGSDIVLFGGVEDEHYIADRLLAKKTVVRLSERIYKSGQWKAISPRGIRKKYHDHTRYRKEKVYLLCCGGYVASDFHIVRSYPDKMFKWGYFPETRTYDIDALFRQKQEKRKQKESVSILWAGRFLNLKHPDAAIRAAARLKADGFQFTLTMVGGGEKEEQLKDMVAQEGLSDVVTFAGFQKPDRVREYMEAADIFLFTSDYKEGWGAVVNEAMNSGCAVVANCAAGAVPFLIKHGENGLIYPHKSEAVLYKELKMLLEQEGMIEALGRMAYRTIAEEWNAEKAAERLLALLPLLAEGKVRFADSGILSKAPVIAPGKMYQHLIKQAK